MLLRCIWSFAISAWTLTKLSSLSQWPGLVEVEGKGTTGCGQQDPRCKSPASSMALAFPLKMQEVGPQTLCPPDPRVPGSPLPALVAQQYPFRVFPLPAPPSPTYDPFPRFAWRLSARRGAVTRTRAESLPGPSARPADCG